MAFGHQELTEGSLSYLRQNYEMKKDMQAIRAENSQLRKEERRKRTMKGREAATQTLTSNADQEGSFGQTSASRQADSGIKMDLTQFRVTTTLIEVGARDIDLTHFTGSGLSRVDNCRTLSLAHVPVKDLWRRYHKGLIPGLNA
ncbi:hypothetical protein NDU88_007245 [Pleurodeles waltl]|uniref:Uncharacterized protein n=1 Tax=Pleurodeles waltl TaxID=8319 RepID=A0AAV7RRA8_PLEWA|nr:hypothetical protein NDU88_007245 [Pleurodeles waltl]